ncbi:MAG TPA: hypothetical protein VFQ80_18185 [Thermomicrobiales bacterium]|jgi:hypothetical protein|nr:hypothetical protein [Thermomicrobiales bacterium]
MTKGADAADRWLPDNPDGSGWAPVDWTTAIRGSRYHYRHGEPLTAARALRPPFYRVVTRLESAALEPHENSYFVPAAVLADFLAELSLLGGAETIWHVEPCSAPPPESNIEAIATNPRD